MNAQDLFKNHIIEESLLDGIYTLYANIKNSELYYKFQIDTIKHPNYKNLTSRGIANVIVNQNADANEFEAVKLLAKNELTELIREAIK